MVVQESAKDVDVLTRRNLEIATIPWHKMDWDAEHPADCRLVDEVGVARWHQANFLVRRQDVTKAKRLRSLSGKGLPTTGDF